MLARNSWQRCGNFYQNSISVKDADYARRYTFPVIHNCVQFRNRAECEVIIRELDVILYSNGEARFVMKASPYSQEKLLSTCKQFFDKNEIDVKITDQIFIPFTNQSAQKIIKLFQYLNAQNSIEEFPDILIEEIKQLADSLEFPAPRSFYLKKHKIDKKIIADSHINPLRVSSKKLVNLLQCIPSNYSLNTLETKLKKLLVKGEDPNQTCATGETPLSFAVLNHLASNEQIIKLLLCYGGNPWIVSDMGLSPIETAWKFGKRKLHDMIVTACKQSEKRSVSSNSIKVTQIQSHLHDKKVIEHFTLSDSRIISTELKKIQDLTPTEYQQLFHAYKISHSNHQNIEAAFNNSFKPEQGKIIDILRDKDHQIIGADTFVVRKNDKDVYVLIDVSFLHPKYQGCGIMPLIDYRLAFSLQALYRECKVSILFLAASYNSIRRLENALYFPRYQPKQMKEKLRDVFSNIFEFPLHWQDASDGVFFNVIEKHQVKVNVYRRPVSTIMEEFYYKHLSGNNEGYVPVLVLPEHDLLETLHAMLAPRDINFYQQYHEFAQRLHRSGILTDIFRNEIPDNLQDKIIMNSDCLFWTNKKRKVSETALIKYDVPESNYAMVGKY